jgi:membrane-associated protease RseP (regulator of RpoE activity)
VPILDGGHLTFYAIEALRGKPLNEETRKWRSGLSG